MTAEVQPLPLGGLAAPKTRRPWIESPGFDLLFFTLSPLTVIPLILLSVFVSPRFGVTFFFLAFPHYASTFSFFFWDEYKQRHRARWLAFFGGPVVIIAAYAALITFKVPLIMQMVLFAWNTFHVARQSCGILSIYRHRAGVFDPVQRSSTNFAILAGSFAMAFWNIETHPQWAPFLNRLGPQAASLLKAILVGIAIVAVVRLGAALIARKRQGFAMTASEMGFLAASFAIFHPFLWMKSSGSATACMLMPHYLQYLGIVWLLNRRRFRNAESSPLQRPLQKLSANTPLIILIVASIGFAAIASDVVLRRIGFGNLFETMYLLLAFEHFYLDGLFWAFRDPTVRNSIGPWLTSYQSN
jgi:hypothetical protein